MSRDRRPRTRTRTRARAQLPALGVRGWLRFLWRQLTSMQTALFLLMLLAVAAVPGSLYPQRAVNPGQTEQYLSQHGKWAKVLDAIGIFDVFSSPWFSAIYLLLFISLIGCVVPRLRTLVRQVRSQPPRTPLRLSRFIGHVRRSLPAETEGGQDVEGLIDAARSQLRRSRYRTRIVQEKNGGLSVSAERGYLREAGNLLFHVALLGVLVAVAMGHMTSYRGQITVVEGEGFSNSLTQYDSFTPGPWFDSSRMPPFRFTLTDFRAEYDTTPGEHTFGQPRMFEADIDVTTPGHEQKDQTLRVNEPLEVPGASMFLLGNGYAPVVTITDPKGHTVAEGPVISLPVDKNYTSQIVVKAPDAEPDQLAVVGLFLPTAVIDQDGPHSQFPDLVDPKLALTAYHGDLGLDDGVPRNAYEIDLASLEQVTTKDGQPLLVTLAPGEKSTLPDGSTITFQGVKRYAAFDVKHDPWQPVLLITALTALAGLTLSLFVPRRRIWVRATRAEDGSITLESAGLARSEDARLAEDVRGIVDRVAASEDHPTPPERSDS